MEANNEMQVLIDKVKKKSTVMKWVIGLSGVLLLAPLVWALAYAVLGAAALMTSLALAAGVGLVVINYTPVLMMKLENKKIQAIVDEATKNPIPTLRAEWIKDGEEIETLRTEIKNGDAKVEAAWGQIQGLKEDLTAEDVAELRADYESQKAEVAAQYVDLGELEAQHRKADTEIKRLNAKWESANALATSSGAVRAANRMDAISAIKRDAAFKAVVAASANAKASIRARIEQRKAAGSKLEAKGGVAVIEGQVITDGGMPVTFLNQDVKVKAGS